ncbi:MAG: lysophospholipid acyltransferase family protein, partial [Vicinamibacteria bacterium]
PRRWPPPRPRRDPPRSRARERALRALLAVPVIVVATVVLAVPALLFGVLDRSGRLPHAVARGWASLILATLGVRVEVSGQENLPSGPAVYAANHGSALDIPILFGHLPVSFRIVHKQSLSLIPFLGWYLFLAGHIAIDRGNAFRAKRSLAAAAARVRGGTSIVVFPEGTRSPDAAVHLFKRGSFVLAIGSGAPVVPVSLVGVKRVAPRGIRTLQPGTVRVRIHPPVPTSSRTPDQAETLAAQIRDVVASGCQAI